MGVSHMESRRKVKVLDHVVGVVKGYKLSFNARGLDKLEPAFANVMPGAEKDEVHGIAIKVSAEDMEILDAQEHFYDKLSVTVQGYNGEVIEDCIMYSNTVRLVYSPEQETPSNRYLNIVLKNAIESGLQDKYIDNLRNTKVYSPDKETLEKRESIPLSSLLPPYSVEQLQVSQGEQDGEKTGSKIIYGYISILGYVIKIPTDQVFFKKHLGRDITSWILQYYKGENHDGKVGESSNVDVENLTEEEREYIWCYIDHYLISGEVVGYLS